MGRRGPAPLPTAVKRARGETRLSRLNLVEPVPRAGEPSLPDGMSERAKAVWRRVLRDAPPGLVRSIDGDILRLYCEAMSRYAVAAEALAEMDLLLVSKRADGPGLVRNPLTQVVRDAADQVRLFARELGFTPSARAGLRITAASEAEAIWSDVGVPRRLQAVADGR